MFELQVGWYRIDIELSLTGSNSTSMTSYRKLFISLDNRTEPNNEWVWSIFAIDYSAFEMST